MARAVLLFVLLCNLEVVVSYVFNPMDAVRSYRLAGEGAVPVVQSLGITFILWNCTYPLAIADPVAHRSSFALVLAQQVLALACELWLYTTLPENLPGLQANCMLFIRFDAPSILVLGACYYLTRPAQRKQLPQLQGGRICLARAFVAIVFLLNVSCAISFMLQPGIHVAAYQLAGDGAFGMARCIGICFLLWNCSYALVLFQPQQRDVFVVVIVQQVLALVLECLLLATLGETQQVLHAAIVKFICFDAPGIALLLAAFWLSRPLRLKD